MVYEKFYNLLGIGDVRGRGGCFVYPEINFADVFRKVYAGTGTMNMDVFPCMYTVRYW